MLSLAPVSSVTVWIYLCVGDDHWWSSAKNWSCSSDGWSAEVPGRHSSFQLLPGPDVSHSHSSMSLYLSRSFSAFIAPDGRCPCGSCTFHLMRTPNRHDCPDPSSKRTLKPKSVWSLTSTGEQEGTELAISCFPVCGARWCHSQSKHNRQWHHLAPKISQ